MENLRSKFISAKAAIGSALLVPVVAFAQSTDPVVTSITEFGTKVGTYAAPVLATVAIGAGLWLGVKYLKKAASKA